MGAAPVVKRVAVVQARMTSTRLPGKVLMDLAGKPMLAQQLRRLKAARMLDEIVLATTENATDDPLVDLARTEGVAVCRGSEHDVLGRFVAAARAAKADVVVRVTGDCPLVDPEVTDRVVRELLDHRDACDYASNVLRRTYPHGLDVEAFFADALYRMDRLGTSPAAREHVTVVARAERPDLFLRRSVEDTENHSTLRVTVDTAVDLEVVRAVYAALDLGNRIGPRAEWIAWLESHPEVTRVNAGIKTFQP